ncbi:hypothetical protein [Shewanella maritima]|uniref:hypothetical protein n=1 Tax=Shewanella maritima TaxID=2520507 RepID=UPI003735D8A1
MLFPTIKTPTFSAPAITTSLRLHHLITFSAMLLLLVSLSVSASSKHDSHHQQLPTSVGLHGMLLFGSETGLFASHLPMFHAPHNAQVVFQLRFDNPRVHQHVIEALSASDSNPIWTIVPNRFDLAQLNPQHDSPISQLEVDIFEGHFERGGQRQHQQQSLIVEKMHIFNPLSMEHQQQPNASARYIAIRSQPNDSTQFYVKHLTMRPDADHLLKVTHASQQLPLVIDIPLNTGLHATTEQLQSAIKTMTMKQESAADSAITPTRIQPLYLELNELK